jgi:hypothetical protein
MLIHALDNGCKPKSMTETLVDKRNKDDKGHSIPSCPTCRDNIAAMLCPNPRKGT